MRRAGLVAMLTAAVALAATDRVVASPVDQLYPIDLRVIGGEGTWSAHDRFRLEWTRPPIADAGLPIVAIGYRIRNSAGTVVGRETRLDGDRSEIAVRVPSAPGAYTTEVWLEGPHGQPGPTASALLRYDPARPGGARASSPNGWIGGDSPATVFIEPPPGPHPVSGIGGYAVSIDRGGETWPCATRSRCGEGEVDLRGDRGGTLGLGVRPEGVSVVRVVAVSGAGVPSADAAVAIVRVDATRPEMALAGAPRGWTSGPVQLVATATDALSGMAPDGPNGPFTAIAIDGRAPRTMLGDSVAATVSGEGIHQVGFYARDPAGNVGSDSPATATVSIDESPPRLAFADRQDPAEPERIEATAADALAGVDTHRGTIAIREAGSSEAWQPLTTTRIGNRLVTRWDSESHPEGIYEFKATAYDLAGNAASSSQRANHTRMVLVNPLKKPVRLQAGFAGARRTGAGTVAYGRRIAYGGRLTSAAGAPLGNLPVRIVESFEEGAAVPQRSTTVTTAADGSFALRLRPGPSRTVEASFAGTKTLGEGAAGGSALDVRGSIRLRASARTADVGGAPVVFGGRVHHLGARLPDGGLPVELQFKIPGGAWTEFRTLRAGPGGRFRYPYAFSDDDSHGVRFQFRAQISGERDWPYEPAASKPVSVAGR